MTVYIPRTPGSIPFDDVQGGVFSLHGAIRGGTIAMTKHSTAEEDLEDVLGF